MHFAVDVLASDLKDQRRAPRDELRHRVRRAGFAGRQADRRCRPGSPRATRTAAWRDYAERLIELSKAMEERSRRVQADSAARRLKRRVAPRGGRFHRLRLDSRCAQTRQYAAPFRGRSGRRDAEAARIQVEKFGGIPKRPTGADCKSAGLRLRWFESTSLHQLHSVTRRWTEVGA